MARLVFLGTPEAAVAPLRTLVEAGHDMALVVSRPDKRRGRGGGMVPSPVKDAALGLGLEVTDSLDEVPGVGAELGVVVAYGRIIPTAVLDQVPIVNLHFSLLPRWRGAAPVERAILEGDAETGVCLMAVEAGLDTGGIYAESATVIDDDETADELRGRLVVMGCALLERYLGDGVAGLPVARDQLGQPSYAEKVLPGEHRIRWEQEAVQIHRVIRLGRAWTTFRGRRLRILRAAELPGSPAPGSDGAGPPGTLEQGTVMAGDGARLCLLDVQPEGRRPMDVGDWLRGSRPVRGERLGV